MLLLLPVLLLLLLSAPIIQAFVPPSSHAISIARLLNTHFMTNQESDDNPRDSFGRSLRGFQKSALKTIVEKGDTIVCKQSVPSLQIYENTSYEVMATYAQSFNEETQQIEKQMLNCLDEGSSEDLPSNSKLYISLFSPVHHKQPVVVTPEEVGLATVRSELGVLFGWQYQDSFGSSLPQHFITFIMIGLVEILLMPFGEDNILFWRQHQRNACTN